MFVECIVSTMEVQFGDDELKQIACDPNVKTGWDVGLVKKFRQRIQQLYAAQDERVLRALKSLHFEKLKGNRDHQHSIRLNDQWRLILEFDDSTVPKTVVVIGIEDYH
jgi:proteic killer suppression protein